MRLQDRPTFRASATARFSPFGAAVDAARALAQSGLYPANCRLLDPPRRGSPAPTTAATPLLLVAFESADHPLDAVGSTRALECARDHGGAHRRRRRSSIRDRGERRRRRRRRGRQLAATRSPRAVHARRDRRARRDQRDVRDRVHVGPLRRRSTTRSRDRRARHRRGRGRVAGVVTCRFTHVYPDGPAPYFTVLALGEEPEQLAQWERDQGAPSPTRSPVGRHDHPPPRGRPRPPALVRPPASRAVRRRPARRRSRRSTRPASSIPAC